MLVIAEKVVLNLPSSIPTRYQKVVSVGIPAKKKIGGRVDNSAKISTLIIKLFLQQHVLLRIYRCKQASSEYRRE